MIDWLWGFLGIIGAGIVIAGVFLSWATMLGTNPSKE